MKKLFSTFFLVFLAFSIFAQNSNKPKYSGLNKFQLNLEMEQARNTIRTGRILTFAGIGAFPVGAILFAKGIGDYNEDDGSGPGVGTGAVLMVGGLVSTVIGIPVWIVGANKRNKIELELVKFNPKGSASVNGIGLKISF